VSLGLFRTPQRFVPAAVLATVHLTPLHYHGSRVLMVALAATYAVNLQPPQTQQQTLAAVSLRAAMVIMLFC
jgi:hypothetical protein